jgi:hypothetical protein
VTVTCPYCSRLARQVGGAAIYPNRADLAAKLYWHCASCDAYVGTHPDGSPLGRLANAPLRKAKIATHNAFDPLWQPLDAQRAAYPEERRPNKKLQGVMRGRAYAWLAEQMGIDRDACHIGNFDEAQCARAAELIGKAALGAAEIRRWAKKLKVTA